MHGQKGGDGVEGEGIEWIDEKKAFSSGMSLF